MEKEKDFIGAVEAAKLLNINYRTFVKMDQKYDFEKSIEGRRILFSKKYLEKFRDELYI